MKYVKSKRSNWQIVLIIALFFAAPVLVVAQTPQTSSADPVPTCGSGATLVRPKTGNPYCSCPQGEVLVTGPTNVCKANCPSGYTAGIDSTSGQRYCNAPAQADPNASTTGAGCVVGNEPSCFQSTTDPAAAGASSCTTHSCNLISRYINPLVTLLSAAVGIMVVISLIIGGIQYGSSAGDPQKITAAKTRIRNSIIALVSFMFLYAFLQFLVPGGIFRT